MTIIVGLTGSIGMGKTTASDMLHRRGLPIFDSDSLVHKMLAKGGAAVRSVNEVFEGVVSDGTIDRVALGKRVFGNAKALKELEQILHPLVRVAQISFIRTCRGRRFFAAVLDVPLLFEVETDRLCDLTLVVSAPKFIQERRVLARPGMTPERLQATLQRQMPDLEKRQRADIVVQTGLNKRHTSDQLNNIVRWLRD